MTVRNWTPDLTSGSHRKVLVLCDWQLSESCPREWGNTWNAVVQDRETGDGTDICLLCSQLRKAEADSPRGRHPDLQENLLETIDTEAKAYLLGWVASNRSLQNGLCTIVIGHQDRVLLEDLRDMFSRKLPLTPIREGKLLALTISCPRTVADACHHLGISPGPNSRTVQFPDIPENLERHFIRGLLDGEGSIRNPQRKGATTPECQITSSSQFMLEALRARTAAYSPRVGDGMIEWQGTNAMDLLGHLYEDTLWKMERMHALYLDWCMWSPQAPRPGQRGSKRPLFYWSRVHPDGVAPKKARVSDSGYDLTLIGDREKDQGRTVRYYRTGICVSPLHGWYFDLVPRSSISKTGYMLANSVGVIDRSYRGEVLVPLRKVDPDAPDLEFPCRLVQLIPRPIIHVEFEEMDNLDETARGDGAFGSTGKA